MQSVLLFIALSVMVTSGGRSWSKRKDDDYDDDKKYYWSKKPGPRPTPKPTKPSCSPGIIQGFFGGIDDIPKGYQLCDGSNGTPDLRDRFLVGAGDKFGFGDTGGDVETALDVENLPGHAHGAGGLVTAEDGLHAHPFKAETNEGGHQHKVIDLEIELNGLHQHDVYIETNKDGDHNHKFDAFAPESYDTHDSEFDVPIQKIDVDKSYPVEVSEDPGHKHKVEGPTEPEGEHSHDIDGKIGADDDGIHFHVVEGATEDEGLHIHEIGGETAPVGEGQPFGILPPFNAVYWICCVAKKEYKPSWYH